MCAQFFGYLNFHIQLPGISGEINFSNSKHTIRSCPLLIPSSQYASDALGGTWLLAFCLRAEEKMIEDFLNMKTC